jgi:hypothetical protein
VTAPQLGDLVWHIHHDVLVEALTESLGARIEFIKEYKRSSEVPTRLRRMKPVRGKLPELAKAYAELAKADAELVKARAEWDKAYAEWAKAGAELDKTGAEWDKAGAEWDKAGAEWDKAIKHPSVLALHAKECPNCPWDGKTIFPKEAEP